MKYLALLPAIILDSIQLLLGLAFMAMQFLTPVGGAAAGAVAAGGYCWYTAPGIISGLYGAAKCALFGGGAGAVISGFAMPIGMVIDISLSMTVGAGILLLLAAQGAFFPSIVIKGFLFEAAPFLDFLPGWTYMVWQCLQEKERQESGASSSFSGVIGFAAGSAAAAVPGGSLLKGATALAQRRFASQQTEREEEGQNPAKEAPRAPMLASRVTPDVRPPKAANDNAPRKAYAA